MYTRIENIDTKGEVIIYKTEDGQSQVDVHLEKEMVWLNLNQLARLFVKSKSVISRHIKNIYSTKELSKDATVAIFTTVQQEGSRKISREIEFYNLDMIISVAFRVNSKRGVHFRVWATAQLKDHIVKGYTINEKRLQEDKRKWYSLT